MENIKNIITVEIQNIAQDFKQYPDKYLTENDVRSFLVAKLLKHPEFSEPQKTGDCSISIPVHTEVRWYGNSGKLRWRSDIVVIDVASLRTKEGFFSIPSKGYAFNKPLAIIEVKLRRKNGGSDNDFIKRIKSDFEKLKEIKNEVDGDYLCILIALDKKSNIKSKLNDIKKESTDEEENIKICYIFPENFSCSSNSVDENS